MEKICFPKRKFLGLIGIFVVVVLVMGTFIISNRIGRNTFRADVEIPQRSVNLHNYNNWTNPTTAEEYNNLYKRDRVVMAENYAASANLTPQIIKNNNASTKVYGYYSLSSKATWESDWTYGQPANNDQLLMPINYQDIYHNDWWLKSADDHKVIERGTPNENYIFMLDVGKTGFKEKYLSELLLRIEDKGFDGIVFDFWWPTMISRWVLPYQLTVPDQYNVLLDDDPSNDKNPDALWYEKAWKPYISYVVPGLKQAGYEVIGNCAGENGTTNPMHAWQRTQIDGVIYEQGVVNWWHLGSDWLNGSVISDRISKINTDPLSEVWVADGGLREAVDGVEIANLEQKRLVSLAYYYLAIPTATQARHSYHHGYNQRPYWYSMWDFNIGTPTAERVQQEVGSAVKYAWSRKYSDGLVLLNYGETPESTESINFVLDRGYVDQAGMSYSGSVTLPAHTGLILKNSITVSPSLATSTIPVVEPSSAKPPTAKPKVITPPVPSPTQTPTEAPTALPVSIFNEVPEPAENTEEINNNRDSVPPPVVTFNVTTKTPIPTPQDTIKYITLSNGDNIDATLLNDTILKVSNLRPVVKGQTDPGATVELKIEGGKNIKKTVTADADGYWQYQLEEDLDTGVYGLTITIHKDGQDPQSQKYNFEVVGGASTEADISSKTGVVDKNGKLAKLWWYLIPILLIGSLTAVFVIKRRKNNKTSQLE